MHLIITAIVLVIAGTVGGTQTQETNSAPLETEVVEEEKPPSPAKRLTWRDNPKDCDLKTQWIRADNFGCIPIPSTPKSEPVAVQVTGNKQDWLKSAGIPESQWTYVDYIIQHESGWNPNAVNASSGACGLGQQLPCGKWPHTWNDPVGALIDANSYAVQRYGTWANAYAFWLGNSWW